MTSFNIQGLKTFPLKTFIDNRGSLTKCIPPFIPQDFFYTISRKHVLRGMHLQNTKNQNDKFIFLSSGKILDVIIDLRPHSPTYKNIQDFELDSKNPMGILIPTGCAHGFLSLSDESQLNYYQEKIYDVSADTGIHFQSFAYPWPKVIMQLSDRDKALPPLKDI